MDTQLLLEVKSNIPLCIPWAGTQAIDTSNNVTAPFQNYYSIVLFPANVRSNATIPLAFCAEMDN